MMKLDNDLGDADDDDAADDVVDDDDNDLGDGDDEVTKWGGNEREWKGFDDDKTTSRPI